MIFRSRQCPSSLRKHNTWRPDSGKASNAFHLAKQLYFFHSFLTLDTRSLLSSCAAPGQLHPFTAFTVTQVADFLAAELLQRMS